MPILSLLLALVLAMPAAADSPDHASSESASDVVAGGTQIHGGTSTDSSAEDGTPTHGGASTGSSTDGADSCAADGGI